MKPDENEVQIIGLQSVIRTNTLTENNHSYFFFRVIQEEKEEEWGKEEEKFNIIYNTFLLYLKIQFFYRIFISRVFISLF